MISSLEVPLAILMREIVSTINISQINVTGLREKMQLAVELTLRAAQQVRLFFNHTLQPVYRNLFGMY